MANDIVLVPGRFAVIHPGHVRLFRYASTLSKEVIVALDVSGISEEEISWRIGAIQGIPYVSRVIKTEKSINEAIASIEPRFVLKGLEFRDSEFPEIETLKRVGGSLVFSSGNYLFSADDQILPAQNRAIGTKSSVTDFMNRNKLTNDGIMDCLKRFKTKRIMVIGDTIVDEIVMCHPLGMSQEEPSIVVTPIEERRFIGGAAIVASHTRCLGASTSYASVIGDDSVGRWVLNSLSELGVESNLIHDNFRKTTLKRRFRSGRQTLFRLTEITPETISRDHQEKIYRIVESEITSLDAIIFSDFSYGLFDDNFARSIVRLASSNSVFTAADSQTSSQIGDLSRFVGVDLVTPTEKEARQELKDEHSGLVQIAQGVQKKLKCKNVLLKLGSDGLLLHGTNSEGTILRTDRVDALNSAALDVSGAGDSLLASATLGMVSGTDIYGAALIGSVAAAIQVSRIGNTPINLDEIAREVIDL